MPHNNSKWTEQLLENQLNQPLTFKTYKEMTITLNKWHIIKTLRSHSCKNRIRLSYEPTENNYNLNISSSNLRNLEWDLCVSEWLLALCRLQRERGLGHFTSLHPCLKTLSQKIMQIESKLTELVTVPFPQMNIFSEFNYPDTYLKSKPHPNPCF